MLSTALAGTNVVCDSLETLKIDPPANQTCGEYLNAFAEFAKGQVQNPDALSQCEYCAMAKTDDFLASVNSFAGDAWRNFGLMWVYIAFNIVGACLIYWLARVPKGSRQKKSS